jgi:hypothetical protein
LAKTDAKGQAEGAYWTHERYWRGPVWLNINFLTLRFLHKLKGRSHAKGTELYLKLRENVLKTVQTVASAESGSHVLTSSGV